MAFFIAPFPGQTYGPRYAGHADIRAYLGLADLVERPHWSTGGTYVTLKARKLPMDFFKVVTVTLTDGRQTVLLCNPGTPAPEDAPRYWKSSKHRCFVSCPDCRAAVPAGRTHQHKCKGGK